MSLDEEFETIFAKHKEEKDITSFYKETRIIEEQLKKDPNLLSLENQLDLYLNNGHYFYGIDDPKTAIEYYQRAWKYAEALTDGSRYFTCSNEIKAQIKLGLGHAYLALEDKNQASENYKENVFWSTKRIVTGHTSVYSYREVNLFMLQDIINKEITVVSPKLVNDPFDCPIYSNLKSFETNDTIRDIANEMRKVYRYIKIRSFVSNKKINKTNMPNSNKSDTTAPEKENRIFLMWSHYAKDHTGICIKYKIDAQFLEKDEKQKIASIMYDVEYNKPSLNPSDVISTFEQAFATKNQCWEYENEVRLIHYDPNCNADFKSLPLGEHASIEAVYFGLRCSPRDIKTIREILKEEVAYYQMKEDDEDIFKLVEVPLNDRAKAMLKATEA
ncbi:DUF2971 domain-containing protein [uncultured Acetobacteroides sp.]|uniref:DUF2971 domain-containing protein n=1 Tax=uncultured Acetobacteroides sp. TaxID=1760811 RepID=UPI0029F5B868|nr:DUF2971 domain-containing protein [uncultured Acetobacteroides sp.]